MTISLAEFLHLMKTPIRPVHISQSMLLAFVLFWTNKGVGQGSPAGGENLIRYGSFQTFSETTRYWSGTYGGFLPDANDADGDGGMVVLLTQTPMSQTVATVAGVAYELSFFSRAPTLKEFSGPNGPDGPLGPWEVNVYLDEFRRGVFENNSQTEWRRFSMDFVATGPTKLGFGGSAGWPLFDHVTLVAVPEPSIAALLTPSLAVGWLSWKRRSTWVE